MRKTLEASENIFTLLGELPEEDADPLLAIVVREFRHRILSLLNVVQCFVDNTDGETADHYRLLLSERISHLFDACVALEMAGQEGVSIYRLFERTLMPYAAPPQERIFMSGPDILLEPWLALPLHMIFYELATNACKHGSLMCPSGTVEVIWETVPAIGKQFLAIEWCERGGYGASPPARIGFGLRLIMRILSDAKIKIDFDPAGVVCRLLVEMYPLPAQRASVLS
jgi:two-component sensor histidine kinase